MHFANGCLFPGSLPDGVGLDIIARKPVEAVTTVCRNIVIEGPIARQLVNAPLLDAFRWAAADDGVELYSMDVPLRVISESMTLDGCGRMTGGAITEMYSTLDDPAESRRPSATTSQQRHKAVSLLQLGIAFQEAGMFALTAWNDGISFRDDGSVVVEDVASFRCLGAGDVNAWPKEHIALVPPEIVAELDTDLTSLDSWVLGCVALGRTAASSNAKGGPLFNATDLATLIRQWVMECGPIPEEITQAAGFQDYTAAAQTAAFARGQRSKDKSRAAKIEATLPVVAQTCRALLTLAPSSRLSALDAWSLADRDHVQDGVCASDTVPCTLASLDRPRGGGTPFLNAGWEWVRGAAWASTARLSTPCVPWTAGLLSLLDECIDSVRNLLTPFEMVSAADVVRRYCAIVLRDPVADVRLEFAAAACLVVASDRDAGGGLPSVVSEIIAALLGPECPPWPVKTVQLKMVVSPAWAERYISRTASNYIIVSALPSRGLGVPSAVVYDGHKNLLKLLTDAKRREELTKMLTDEQQFLVATCRTVASTPSSGHSKLEPLTWATTFVE